jgi:DNA-directed RNA polymerase specialized sigma24 family protein
VRPVLHEPVANAGLVDALTPPEPALLTWLELEQKSAAEVAALTGWSRTLVRVKAFRARRRLAALFQQLENPDA